ncbi:MAG: hypothetical protein ACI8W8_000389 [Rhodothermales bacterium]|jgi:hypothetical protein
MKYFCAAISFVLSLHVFGNDRPKPTPETAAKVQQARAILEAWRGDSPANASRKLHVVYWRPSDREAAPGYRQRLTRTMLDIRDYYGHEMGRLGFGKLQPGLDLAEDGLLRIHFVQSNRPDKDFSVKSGHYIRGECYPILKEAGIDGEQETLVIFTNMSRWDPDTRRVSQNSPYYASGSHVRGTAWQVDSAILDIDSITDKGNFVYDGQYGRMSLGAYNSMFIGGITHEIGHALGLPHIRELSAQKGIYGTALMGSGNRTYGQERRGEGKGSFLTLAHGLRLAAHPMFSNTAKAMHEQPQATLEDVEVETAPSSFQMRGRIAAKLPCYAVLGYWDPAGGRDYDSLSTVAIPNADGAFELSMSALPRTATGQLRIVPLFVNGSAASFSYAGDNPFNYAFELDADRKPALKCLHCKTPESQ